MSGDVEGPGGGRVRGFRYALAGIVFLHVVLGLLLFEPVLFTGGDNVRYMILGESLGSARGYLDLHLPGAPLHTKYPPGYPAVLAVLGLVGGVQLFKLASLAFTGATVALTGVLGRRLFRGDVGLAAAAVLAVNPVLLQYSHWVLSEAAFLLLVTAALCAWASADGEVGAGEGGAGGGGSPGEGSGRLGWLALALAVGAFLTRTAGLPLLAVAVLVPAARRRWRTAAIAAAAVLAVTGGWAAYQALAAPDRTGYLGELLMVNPYAPEQGTVGVAGLLGRAAENAWLYVSAVLPGSFLSEPEAGRPPAGTGRALLGIAVVAAALTGWIRRSLEGIGPAELFTVLYAGIIALWPSVWTDQRFLLPLLPLVGIYGLAGVRWWSERAARLGSGGAGRAVRAATAAVAVAAVLVGARDAAGRIPERLDCIADWQRGSPCMAAGYRTFFEMGRWAREHTPRDAIVANRKPEFFWWFSRRQGDVYPFSDDPAVVLRGLEEMGATHVLLDRIFSTSLRYLQPAILAHRDRFELVHRGGPPEIFLLRFTRRPRSASGPESGDAGRPPSEGSVAADGRAALGGR